MIGRVNHVALAVPNLDDAIETYKTMLGATVSTKIEQKEHGVTIAFVNLPNTKIELVTPLGRNSPLVNFLQKNPTGGIHHICYEVEDINRSQKYLLEKGARLVGNKEPRPGAHGNLVLFLHPKDFNGTLIELEEVPREIQ